MKQEAYLEMYSVEDQHWWFVARRRIIQKTLDKYLQNIHAPNILEVGCGTGGNLQLLSSYGNIHAMEFNDEARMIANKRQICSVENGSLPNNIPFTEDFDLICMLDVLEHMDDDLMTIQAIGEKLKPKGKLVITVPAYRFLWSAHDVALHHKRRYTKKQLLRMIQKSNLKPLYATYFNTFLFPAIALVRILNNVLGKEDSTDVKMPSTGINSSLTQVFSSESLLIPRTSLPFGVSILIVIEKRNSINGQP